MRASLTTCVHEIGEVILGRGAGPIGNADNQGLGGRADLDADEHAVAGRRTVADDPGFGRSRGCVPEHGDPSYNFV